MRRDLHQLVGAESEILRKGRNQWKWHRSRVEESVKKHLCGLRGGFTQRRQLRTHDRIKNNVRTLVICQSMHFFSQITLLRIDDRTRSGIEERLHLVRLPGCGDQSRATAFAI